MNKYQEAKAWIDKINAHPEWARCDFEEPALSQLTELVEKATPKKVLKRETNGQEIKIGNGTFKLATMWYCPSCKNWISPSTSVKYCGHCGQALDWSKEDENR